MTEAEQFDQVMAGLDEVATEKALDVLLRDVDTLKVDRSEDGRLHITVAMGRKVAYHQQLADESAGGAVLNAVAECQGAVGEVVTNYPPRAANA